MTVSTRQAWICRIENCRLSSSCILNHPRTASFSKPTIRPRAASLTYRHQETFSATSLQIGQESQPPMNKIILPQHLRHRNNNARGGNKQRNKTTPNLLIKTPWKTPLYAPPPPPSRLFDAEDNNACSTRPVTLLLRQAHQKTTKHLRQTLT
jgi:hypothetical protein